ncbi:site-2 protease family protein [soil metagenome]
MVTEWLAWFAVYRVVVIRNDEVIQGVFRPEIDLRNQQVQDALKSWPGQHYLQRTDEGVEVTLVRSLAPPPRERWWLHVLLGVLTLATTTLAGAYLQGQDPLQLIAFAIGPFRLPIPAGVEPLAVLPGLLFSVPLMVVLLGHELGHYLVARSHGMDVSPPFFIPAPHWFNLIGTFGAFIRLRSATMNRGVLMDVGAAGPIASFLLSLPMLAAGLVWSRDLPLATAATERSFVVLFGDQPIWLGGSGIMNLFASAFAPGSGTLLLHPLAFAGWLGLFVTALNLFPLAQLDGGHIIYALLGRVQTWVGAGFLLVLLILGFWWWGWWLWAAMILVLGRGTVRHPTVFDPSFPLPPKRSAVGWGCVIIFLLTFVAFPLTL